MSLPAVSDHALCRYLERVMGFDLETVRRRIALTCKDATSARCLHHEGYLYHIRDAREGGTIVTTVRVNKLKNPRRVPRGKTMDGTE